MIDQKKEEQREFFDEFNRPKSAADRLRQKYISRKKFFVTVSIENLVLFAIITILCVVFSFSLGVERGKHFGTVELANIDIEVKGIKSESINLTAEAPVTKKALISTKEIPVDAPIKTTPKYAIQAATFRKAETAKKEVELLKKEGFQAFIVESNDLFQVRIGKYDTSGEAKTVLKKLKEKYSDCFVKKIQE